MFIKIIIVIVTKLSHFFRLKSRIFNAYGHRAERPGGGCWRLHSVCKEGQEFDDILCAFDCRDDLSGRILRFRLERICPEKIIGRHWLCLSGLVNDRFSKFLSACFGIESREKCSQCFFGRRPKALKVGLKNNTVVAAMLFFNIKGANFPLKQCSKFGVFFFTFSVDFAQVCLLLAGKV